VYLVVVTVENAQLRPDPTKLADDLERDLGDAVVDHSQCFCSSHCDVHNASADEWTAIVDPHGHGSAISDVPNGNEGCAAFSPCLSKVSPLAVIESSA
jgi:hypothetical protein